MSATGYLGHVWHWDRAARHYHCVNDGCKAVLNEATVDAPEYRTLSGVDTLDVIWVREASKSCGGDTTDTTTTKETT